MKKVKVRFAPSPTGALHMGGVRTALYNYLFAKKHGGEFILRIEDTDQTRFVPGAERYIIDSLNWCGIIPTGGVGFGSNDSEFRQSDRNKAGLYKKYVDELIADGKAYYAFDAKEDLDAIRENIKLLNSKGTKTREFAYGVFTRSTLRNSLHMTAEMTQKLLDDKVPYVVRLKMPHDENIIFNDIVRGKMSVKSHTIDDKVIWKSDGMPTYHLANVVDDHLMGISHVIRGEEWLPSAPLHVMLYKYLGWEDSMPEFAHLPLIMGPRGKLSKRDGKDLGFPVFPLRWDGDNGYKENGYLPEAFNNMLAFLGWNPGGSEEIFNMDELIEKFSLEKIGKSGAKFDLKKAEWFNQQHMKKVDNSFLANMWYNDYIKVQRPEEFTAWLNTNLRTVVIGNHDTVEATSNTVRMQEYIDAVCGLLKQKVGNVKDFWESGKYFFKAPIADSTLGESTFLTEMIAHLKNDVITHDSARNAFNEAVKSSGEDARNAGMLLRKAVTGMNVGPPIFDVMSLLGLDETKKRLASHIVVITE